MENETTWADHMIWDAFIKREELESSPGVIDDNLVRALTLNTYLTHIREMVMDGTGKFPDYVSEHLETVMMDIFMCHSQVIEGRMPEMEEITAHLKLPENVEARKKLTTLCCNSDPDNWPETAKQLQEMLPGADLGRIKRDAEERKEYVKRVHEELEQKGFIEIRTD